MHVLRETLSDAQRESSAKWEDETDLCLPKNESSAENCNSPNPESATGQFEHDVCIADRNNKKITTSEDQTAVAKESDGGWGWVIVLGGFAITMLLGGCYVSFSLLYLEFVDLFDATRSVVGWIGSLHMFMNNILGIFISVAITRYGSRAVCITGSVIGLIGFALGSLASSVVYMYLTLGLLAGSGSGMMLMGSMVLIQQHFNRRRALASGIANMGYSVGGLTFGPLTAMLLRAYAVRGTLLIIAGMYFQMSVFCCLFRPAPGHCHVVSTGRMKLASNADGGEEMVIVENVKSDGSLKLQHNGDQTAEQSFVDVENHHRLRSYMTRLFSWLRQLFADLFDFSLLHSVSFQLFTVATFCLFFGMSSFVQHTPSRAVYFNIESRLISVLPTMIFISTIASRLVFTFVANMSCTCLILQFAISLTLSGLVHTTMWLASTFELMALCCVLFGAANGCFGSTMPTVLVELNGIRHIAKSMAIWTLAIGTGCLLGTPFSGFLFDVTANYDMPFVVCGSIEMVGGVCALSAYVIRRRQRTAEHLS